MKKTLLTFIVCAISSLVMADNVPAFPGAEGHGRYVTGGRGGEVRHVTTLVDDGKATTKGSIRWAVSGTSKKTVVFDVGGIIYLKKELVIAANTTILGQTAPDPGITIRYYTVRPNGNNIIMRFIRCRMGEEDIVVNNPDAADGADATWTRNQKNIILDHCSFSWSIDEIASFYDNCNFTMQWCTLGEGLANGHTKGVHSYGGIWGGKHASFHHNFIAHVQNRAPRFCGARYGWTGWNTTLTSYGYTNPIQAENVDFRNCVMYNWGTGNGCYGGTGGGQINIVNNYYKAGPATSNKTRVTQISVANSSNADGSSYMGYCSRYFIEGNYVASASVPENYDWNGVIYDSGVYTIDGEKYCADANHLYGENVTYKQNSSGTDCVRIEMDEPTVTGEVTTHTAQNAYLKVLEGCGASLYRDAVDARYMQETQDKVVTYYGSIIKLPGIIDKVADQGTYELKSTTHEDGYDTDGDGIPDAWETANGLNPNDASDGKTYTIDTKGWYTNLEVYANSLVEDIMKAGNADAETAVDEYYPSYKKPTGISNIRTSAIKATEYYSLDGRKLSQPQQGINIRVEHMSNGQKVATKIIK